MIRMTKRLHEACFHKRGSWIFKFVNGIKLTGIFIYAVLSVVFPERYVFSMKNKQKKIKSVNIKRAT